MDDKWRGADSSLGGAYGWSNNGDVSKGVFLSNNNEKTPQRHDLLVTIVTINSSKV